MPTYRVEIVIEGRDQASGALHSAGGALQNMANIAGGIIGARLIEGVGQRLQGLITDSIGTAARVQEMGSVLGLLGERAGWLPNVISENVETIRSLGIETGVAQDALAQFARYGLQAADASRLARVAQDAAVLSMSNSSDTLDRLMHGVLTQNSLVLRNAGIITQASDAMKEYAEANGIAVTEMTEVQRVQAMMNAVFAEGERIAGVYEKSMEEPGKRLRSLTRHFYEAKLAIGQAFLPAFEGAVVGVENFIKGVRTALEEGGGLYELIQRLAAPINAAFTLFGSLAEAIRDAGIGSIEFFEAFDVLGEGTGDRVREIYNAVKPVFDYVILHKDEIVAGIGAIVGAFVGMRSALSVINTIKTAVFLLANPITAILAIIGLLAAAWTGNWFGIRDAVMPIITTLWEGIQNVVSAFMDAGPGSTEFFEAFETFGPGVREVVEGIFAALQPLGTFITTSVVPAFMSLFNAIAPNIGPVLQLLWQVFSDIGGVLLTVLGPAMSFIGTLLSVVFSVFQSIGTFLGVILPPIIQTLSTLWNTILAPALRVIGTILSVVIFPILKAVANVIGAVLNLAITALAGLFQNVLMPAIQIVVKWFGEKLKPIIETVQSAIEKLAPVIEKIIDWLGKLAESIGKIKLPKWLQPGSPTPFELGLRGIASALREAEGSMSRLAAEASLSMATRGGLIPVSTPSPTSSTVYNYYLTAQYRYQDERTVADEIRMLQMMRG